MNVLPIILGTDINAYGVARSLHEAYGLHSLALGVKPLYYTRKSSIVSVELTPNFTDEAIFLEKMDEVACRFKDYRLLLIPCSDHYNGLVSKYHDILADHYALNVIDFDLQQRLENKKDFYRICESYGLDYPTTWLVDKDNYATFDTTLTYPVALKANDSIAYVDLEFPGKKKAYKIENAVELKRTMMAIYQAGYQGELIIQDFIPGDASSMFVLNAYVNQAGKVKMMSLGKCLLDECFPTEIGNYNALMTMGDDALYRQYTQFLEKINYRGFANFDLKYDQRDGKYKVFEINIRQGRSSYYMNAGGCNFMTYFMDDVYFHDEKPAHYHYDRGLWLYCDPSVLRTYVSPKEKDLAEELLRRGYTFTQWYDQDRNLSRFMDYMRRRLSTIKYYAKYEKAYRE